MSIAIATLVITRRILTLVSPKHGSPGRRAIRRRGGALSAWSPGRSDVRRRMHFAEAWRSIPGQLLRSSSTRYEAGDLLPQTLSSREGFDLPTAMRGGGGARRGGDRAGTLVVGRKMAFGNHAVLEKLKLRDRGVGVDVTTTPCNVQANAEDATPVPFAYAPKLEPEIVFKLKSPPTGDLVRSRRRCSRPWSGCRWATRSSIARFPNGSSSRRISSRRSGSTRASVLGAPTMVYEQRTAASLAAQLGGVQAETVQERQCSSRRAAEERFP